MARILFTVLPLTGHLNPALALSDVLVKEGHEVAWSVHQEFLHERLPTNSRIYPLDGGYIPRSLGGRVRGLESVRLFFEEYLLPLTRHALAPLEAAVRDFQPHVMAVDHQMLAGALVARKMAVPWASLVSTTASIVRLAPLLDAWVAEQYRTVQRSYLCDEQIVQRPDFSPHSVIVFSIESLLGGGYERVAAPYAFVGPASGNGRRHVEFPWEWLRKDMRSILVTLGTVSRDRDHRFFEVIMEAMSQLPSVQAVMVAPQILAQKATENVLICDYVPQLTLLDRVDGVICHAGHNTVCEALARGLPLAVAPIRDDQPVIARQVIDAGAGVFMRHGKVTASTARGVIECLLNDANLSANARRLRAELEAAPGIYGAAEIIVQLSRRHSQCI